MENQERDELIESIGCWILAGEENPAVLDPLRFQQMKFTNSVLERLARGTNIQISAALHEPFKSMGCIYLEGDSMEFADCKWLGRAIEFASNLDVFPTQEGKVKLVLTFHGLTAPIKAK